MHKDKLFIGGNGQVGALNPATGEILWDTKLKGGFVNVFFDGKLLLASTQGELYSLDPNTGAVLWHNELKGWGYGIISIASGGNDVTTLQAQQAAQAAATAGMVAATAAAAT
jgi:outer membrane protein assembly factor BamB